MRQKRDRASSCWAGVRAGSQSREPGSAGGAGKPRQAKLSAARREEAFEAAAQEAREGKLFALELLAVQELTRSILGPAGCGAEGERRLEELATARLKKPLSAFAELLAEPKP